MLNKAKKLLMSSIYTKLAPCYDLISWFVSKGKWSKWQRYSIIYIQGEIILEVSCGTGDLMLQLNKLGYLTFGVDLSKDMLAVCLKKFHGYSIKPNLIQGDMLDTPIKNENIDTVIVTFPTNDILSPSFYNEIFRLLKSGGRLIMVDFPHFYKKTAIDHFFDYLSNIGDKRNIKDIKKNLINYSFKTSIEEIKDQSSSVTLIIADKQ